jgi:hypothetical protein
MCRGSMCFRGITKLKKQWHREKQEQVYIDLTERIFDELGETYDDIILSCIEVVQNRFEYIMYKYPKISCEVLNLVLGITWMDVDYLLNFRQEPVYEPKTYEKYLMIGKHEKKPQYIIMKSRNGQIIILLAIVVLLIMNTVRLYGKAKRVEKYTRDELQKDLDNLLTELEKDGLLSQEILDVPA